MRADRAAGHRTALLAALASAVLSLCAAKETLQRIFPGGATTPAAAVDASASQSAADDGPVAEESPERTPIIIVAVYAPRLVSHLLRFVVLVTPLLPPATRSSHRGGACSVGVTVLFLGCLIWCKRRRSDRRASITQHRVCPSGAAAVSRLCSPDVRAAFLDAPVPPHATTIQLRDLQYELLQLRPPPAFEAMAESAWLEMVHSQQIADCDGSSCERCIQRCGPRGRAALLRVPTHCRGWSIDTKGGAPCKCAMQQSAPECDRRRCRTQVLQFWGSYTESTRMAPLPRKARFSAQDALSLGPFDVQLNLSFYPPETDMEPEVERQVDAVVARGVSKGAAWGVRGSALERDAGYDICGVYNARTGRCARRASAYRTALAGGFSGVSAALHRDQPLPRVGLCSRPASYRRPVGSWRAGGALCEPSRSRRYPASTSCNRGYRIVWTETYTDSKSRAVFSGELLELSKGCSSSHSKGGVLQPNALFENMCEAPEAAAPNGKPSQQVVITVGGDSGGDGPRLWMLRGAYASNSHVCGACPPCSHVLRLLSVLETELRRHRRLPVQRPAFLVYERHVAWGMPAACPHTAHGAHGHQWLSSSDAHCGAVQART